MTAKPTKRRALQETAESAEIGACVSSLRTLRALVRTAKTPRREDQNEEPLSRTVFASLLLIRAQLRLMLMRIIPGTHRCEQMLLRFLLVPLRSLQRSAFDVQRFVGSRRRSVVRLPPSFVSVIFVQSVVGSTGV